MSYDRRTLSCSTYTPVALAPILKLLLHMHAAAHAKNSWRLQKLTSGRRYTCCHIPVHTHCNMPVWLLSWHVCCATQPCWMTPQSSVSQLQARVSETCSCSYCRMCSPHCCNGSCTASNAKYHMVIPGSANQAAIVAAATTSLLP